MGQGACKIVDCEKTSWIKPHTLEYSQKLRDTQLALINKFGRDLQLCHFERDYNGWGLLQYQHWFVTDGTWTIEFGGGEIENANVQIHSNRLPTGYFIEKRFEMTLEVKERMRKVCGATNYSLALRNCEHVAR